MEAVKLAHPKAEHVMCLFTDASADHWSGMLTQVARDEYQATTDVQQWPHEPLGFVGGTFRGSARNWAIPDKEGFAIRESCAKFAHLLIRDGGFVIFTDHRNLVYIFNPRGRVPSMSSLRPIAWSGGLYF